MPRNRTSYKKGNNHSLRNFNLFWCPSSARLCIGEVSCKQNRTVPVPHACAGGSLLRLEKPGDSQGESGYSAAMRMTAPIFFVGCAGLVLAGTFMLDDGFTKVESLQRSLEQHRRSNGALEQDVERLQREIAGLQGDDRVLERVARSELGLVRPDELMVIFDRKEAVGSAGASRAEQQGALHGAASTRRTDREGAAQRPSKGTELEATRGARR